MGFFQVITGVVRNILKIRYLNSCSLAEVFGVLICFNIDCDGQAITWT